MAIIFDLEGIPVPEDQVPDEVDNLDESFNAVPVGENYEPGAAVFVSESSTSAETSSSERQQSNPTVEERIEAIRKIVADGKLNLSDKWYLRTVWRDLSVSDRFVLLERFDAAVADGTFRTDFEVAKDFWEKQDRPYNCGVAAQKMILDALGIPTSEAILTLRALIDGSLIHNEGMQPFRAGEILERHGVEVDLVPYATVADLEAKLEAGLGVLVGVDGEEVWDGDKIKIEFLFWEWEFDEDKIDGGRGTNHVVWLREIDRSDPENPVAVINDSGHPEGAEMRVPLHIFMDAFEDSEGFAIVTKYPLDELRQHFEQLH